jgi:hypothetical protein
MRRVRIFSLVLLAASMLGGAPAFASNMGTASVTTVGYRDHDSDWRHRERHYHWEWYRGRDGRWHRHYAVYYVWR